MLHAHFNTSGLRIAFKPKLGTIGLPALRVQWSTGQPLQPGLPLRCPSHSSFTAALQKLMEIGSVISPQTSQENRLRPGSHLKKRKPLTLPLLFHSALLWIKLIGREPLLGSPSLCGNQSRTESGCFRLPGTSCSQSCNPLPLRATGVSVVGPPSEPRIHACTENKTC